MTSAGVDWQREKWQSGFGSKFIRQGEKNAVKYADEIIVLSKGVQDYFKETYGRETHFIPNGVNHSISSINTPIKALYNPIITHPEERIWAGRTPPAAAPGPGRSEDQARQDETILHG